MMEKWGGGGGERRDSQHHACTLGEGEGRVFQHHACRLFSIIRKGNGDWVQLVCCCLNFSSGWQREGNFVWKKKRKRGSEERVWADTDSWGNSALHKWINPTATYFSLIVLIMAGGMLSLSYVFSESKNFMSASTFCDGPQKSLIIRPEPPGSGFLSDLIPFMMQIDSITNFTVAGGFWTVGKRSISCRITKMFREVRVSCF